MPKEMTTFEREYQELDSVTFSVKGNTLLYTIRQAEPIFTCFDDGTMVVDETDPVADYLNAHPPREKPWKLRFLIVLGLAIWFWWQVGEYVMRMAR
jgi:hypothetical protein